jgi:predicted AlkP superfamily pyrophosphatase or phosphodiesterase
MVKRLRPALLLLLALAACASGKKAAVPAAETERCEYAEASPEARARAAQTHLIFIGFDGLGGHYLPKAEMPTVKRFMAEGASTLKARSVMPSNSWPNWSSMYFGGPPETTGYLDTEAGPQFSGTLRDGYGFFPGIFALLRQSLPENTTAFFYEWDKLEHLCPAGAADPAEHIPDLAARPDEVERVARFIAEEKPQFAAVIFNEPDHVGHQKRHGSAAYYEKLAELDKYVARIEEAARDGGFYEDTVFVISADHGGVLWGHGFNTPRQRNIPLIACGKNIKKNYAIKSEVNIYDIAPTFAAVFGLTPPAAWKVKALREIVENEN